MRTRTWALGRKVLVAVIGASLMASFPLSALAFSFEGLGDVLGGMGCVSPPSDPGYCERQADRVQQQRQLQELQQRQRQMDQRQQQMEFERNIQRNQQPVRCTYPRWDLGGRMLCVMPDGSTVVK